MSGESTLYTIGTALNRARDHQVPVRILVDGHWLGGHVLAVDGYGIVLNGAESEHAVVRMDSVTAVEVMATAPQRAAVTRAG